MDGAFGSWPDGDTDIGAAYFISSSEMEGGKAAAQSFVNWAVDIRGTNSLARSGDARR